MPKKKKTKVIRGPSKKLKLQASLLAKNTGISKAQALEELVAKRKEVSRLYSEGLRSVKAENAKKKQEIHKVCGIKSRTVSFIQGGAPGLGKKS